MATQAHQRPPHAGDADTARPRPPFTEDPDHIIVGHYQDSTGVHTVALTRWLEGPWHLVDVACVDRYIPGETLIEVRAFADAYLNDHGGK